MNTDPHITNQNFECVSVIPYVDPELIRLLSIIKNITTEFVNEKVQYYIDQVRTEFDKIGDLKFVQLDSLCKDTIAAATKSTDMLLVYHRFVAKHYDELERAINLANGGHCSTHKIKFRGIWPKLDAGRNWCKESDGNKVCPPTFFVQTGSYGLLAMNRSEYAKTKKFVDEELSKTVMTAYLTDQMQDPQNGTLIDTIPDDPLPTDRYIYGQDWAFFSYYVPPFEMLLTRYKISCIEFLEYFKRESLQVLIQYVMYALAECIDKDNITERAKYVANDIILDKLLGEDTSSLKATFTSAYDTLFTNYVRPGDRMIQLFKIRGAFAKQDECRAACEEAHASEKYVDSFPVTVGKWYDIPNNIYQVTKTHVTDSNTEAQLIKSSIFSPERRSAETMKDVLQGRVRSRIDDEHDRELSEFK